MPVTSAGLFRASNAAIGNALAHDGFATRVRDALSTHPELKVTVAWGTVSELVPNDTVEDALDSLRNLDPQIGSRVSRMALEGMHHAGADDIDLHVAMVSQGLKQAA